MTYIVYDVDNNIMNKSAFNHSQNRAMCDCVGLELFWYHVMTEDHIHHSSVTS